METDILEVFQIKVIKHFDLSMEYLPLVLL